MKHLISLHLLLLTLACSAELKNASELSSEAAPKTLLGLNDVSILLPFDQIPDLWKNGLDARSKPDPETFAKGQPALPLDGESFIPAWVYAAVEKELEDDIEIRSREFDAVAELEERTAEQLEFMRAVDGNLDLEQPELVKMKAEESYRLVSLRFDPCVNKLQIASNLDACQQEMRLVFQAIHSRRGPRDANFHVIYRLDRADFQSAIDSMRRIVRKSGMDTSKEALQPQPVVAKQGLEGNYYKGVIALVHRYARNSNLTHIAFLRDSMGGLQGHWPMVKFAVKNNRLERLPLKGVHRIEGEAPKFVQRINGDRAILAEPSPLSSTKDTLFPGFWLTNEGRFDPKMKDRKIANSFRLENPRLHDGEDLDCASCHMADTERDLVLRGQAPKAPEDAYKSLTWNLEVKQPKPNSTSLQIFSFFNGDFRIAPRVINESAEAADLIHSRF